MSAQLVAIGELFAYRLSRCSDTEEWVIDTMETVAAEVAAALRISQGLAASRLRYACALRERLPKVGEIFQAGDIDYRHLGGQQRLGGSAIPPISSGQPVSSLR